MTDTIRPIYDETGSIRCLDIDGTRYTPDELRAIIAERDRLTRELDARAGLPSRCPGCGITFMPSESRKAQFGTCPRCGNQLSNVSPGISIVAGGVQVCTSCLALGETEVARARGL
jgi:predicted Zn-ribbon and HTH transcriptional regulator